MSQNFLQEYTDFVDKVTSEASKSSGKMSERIDYLNSKNVEVSRLFTAGIGLSGEVGEFNEIIKKKLKDEKKIAKLKQKQEIKRQKEKKKLAKLNKKETLKKIKPIKKPDNQIVQYEEICSTLDKCEIDEISSYLMKIGKTKKYPDLSSE